MLVSELLEAKKKPAPVTTAAPASTDGDRTPTRTVRIAPEFEKAYKTFRKAFPQVAAALREFAAYRANSPLMQGWGQKDKMSNNAFKGFWHCHLVYGKAILFYRISEQYLDLYTITDHLALDAKGGRQSSLSDRMNALDPKSFAVAPLLGQPD